MAPHQPPPDPQAHPDHMVVDGRAKRGAELAAHIEEVAHRLVAERRIARKRAEALVEKRKQQHAWYHGSGAKQWARLIKEHPERATKRAPEPRLLTVDEALPLVMKDVLREVWSEAHEIGCRELADRQRPNLDRLWMFLQDAEATAPDPKLTADDAFWVRRAYQLGTQILEWARLLESGRGNETVQTEGNRPIKSIRHALRRRLDAMESEPVFQDAAAAHTDERVVETKEAIQALLTEARRVYRLWKTNSGRDWQAKKLTAFREISKAFADDLQDVAPGNKRVEEMSELLFAFLEHKQPPVNAAIEATALLLGVKPDAAKEGARERLAKRAAASSRAVASPAPTALALLGAELQFQSAKGLLRESPRRRRRTR
jgi:hypothetical protein